MAHGNELTELYDCLSVLYNSLPDETHPEWQLAVKSVLYGDELLAENAACYGKQQKNRNWGKRKDYARRHGNGRRVTDFSAIRVAEPRPEDHQYVPDGAMLPVAPDSDVVLPVMVSDDEVEGAIVLLAEFPAEPVADHPGDGGDALIDPTRVQQARQRTSGACSKGRETTVLFVSDTHFGYERRLVTGRGNTVPWSDEILTRDVLVRILNIAIEQEVDAIIHTGDFLDHEVDEATLDTAESGLALLSQLGIPIFCIIGSHDQDSFNPQHRDSVDGIAWLKTQIHKGNLTELTTNPTAIADGSLNAYGISAGNVGIDDVGKYYSRQWGPSDVEFGPAFPGPNILCLHDSVTPYRSSSDADVDLNQLLSQSQVSFDCVLVGDEHRPRGKDFESGYTFETHDGKPVFYTGPAARISPAYRDHEAFVTELTISEAQVTATRHQV